MRDAPAHCPLHLDTSRRIHEDTHRVGTRLHALGRRAGRPIRPERAGRDEGVGRALGGEPAARSVRRPGRPRLVRGPGRQLHRLPGPQAGRVQALRDRRGRAPAQPDRRRAGHGLVRRQPRRPHRQARPEDR